eukprot:TRINITY_DN28885_c0_g1_i1.p1 TRINITY_DN28885_c0_g1~~TRINITY_DN28885_c0_g1_i1.p1  ORF type:complete len:241 (-),score=36.11 TRINITY_DN28885_c0_g1_i1:143-865(-)
MLSIDAESSETLGVLVKAAVTGDALFELPTVPAECTAEQLMEQVLASRLECGTPPPPSTGRMLPPGSCEYRLVHLTHVLDPQTRLCDVAAGMGSLELDLLMVDSMEGCFKKGKVYYPCRWVVRTELSLSSSLQAQCISRRCGACAYTIKDASGTWERSSDRELVVSLTKCRYRSGAMGVGQQESTGPIEITLQFEIQDADHLILTQVNSEAGKEMLEYCCQSDLPVQFQRNGKDEQVFEN